MPPLNGVAHSSGGTLAVIEAAWATPAICHQYGGWQHDQLAGTRAYQFSWDVC